MNLRLGPRLYDAAYAWASQDRCGSVSEWIRDTIAEAIKGDDRQK